MTTKKEVAMKSYASPEIGGQTQGDGVYANNETATMIAMSALDYEFVHWMEDDIVVSEDQEYTFEVDQDRLLVAIFDIIDNTNQPFVNHYKLYPNPCSDIVSLELDTKATICITNANGLLIRQINDFKKKHIIDLSQEAKGLYFIKIASDDHIFIMKLLKE